MLHRWGRRGLAFSLLELMFVVAIVAILAAMAIPRLSRGARGTGDAALRKSVGVLRDAIDRYAVEHGGASPQCNKFAEQLTTYTSSDGHAQASRDAAHIWGPYLRAIPPLPVGASKGSTHVKQVEGAGVGWIYDQAAGTIRANCADTEVDDTGKKYKDY